MSGWPVAWKCFVAWRFGLESQQLVVPQTRHWRRWTQRDPIATQASQTSPPGRTVGDLVEVGAVACIGATVHGFAGGRRPAPRAGRGLVAGPYRGIDRRWTTNGTWPPPPPTRAPRRRDADGRADGGRTGPRRTRSSRADRSRPTAANARWRALLAEGGPILADGAMGTMLFASGLQFGDPPEAWNVSNSEVVRRIHRGYLDAGSRIVMTNTFGGNRLRLRLHGLDPRVTELNRTAAILVRAEVDAAGGHALVAGDIGPSGEIMAPLGTLEEDEAIDVFAEQAAALIAGGVDLIWIETMSHLSEIRAAIRGARRASPTIPIIATMTFDTRGYTMMGVSPEQAARSLLEAGADAIGGNCGNGPGRAPAGHREDARRRARMRSWSRSRTPGCPSWSTCARSTGPIRDDGRGGRRVPAGRRPDHRRVLRVDAGPPRGDGRGARACRAGLTVGPRQWARRPPRAARRPRSGSRGGSRRASAGRRTAARRRRTGGRRG